HKTSRETIGLAGTEQASEDRRHEQTATTAIRDIGYCATHESVHGPCVEAPVEVSLRQGKLHRFGRFRRVGHWRRRDEVCQRFSSAPQHHSDVYASGKEHRDPRERGEFGLLAVIT